MSVSEDDNVLVTGVAGEKNAIGFFGAAYYFENASKLQAVKIVNPKTGEAVLPEPAKIESGESSILSGICGVKPITTMICLRTIDRVSRSRSKTD